MQKIRRDDNVLVLKGADFGRIGVVRKVIPRDGRKVRYCKRCGANLD